MKFRAGSLQNKGERLAQRKLWVWKHVVEIVPHIDASLLCTLPVVEKIGVEIRRSGCAMYFACSQLPYSVGKGKLYWCEIAEGGEDWEQVTHRGRATPLLL